jgi:hypothetical protein
LIFHASSHYTVFNENPTIVCDLSPKITRVYADYSDLGTVSAMTLADGVVADPKGPAGLTAINTLRTALFLAQGEGTNTMGDEMNGVLNDVLSGGPIIVNPQDLFGDGTIDWSRLTLHLTVSRVGCALSCLESPRRNNTFVELPSTADPYVKPCRVLV